MTSIDFIEEILTKITLVPNPDELAFQIALKTECRTIDSYFIATAKLTNLILITNDKIITNNAKEYGIKAYYLIEEFDKTVNRIKEL